MIFTKRNLGRVISFAFFALLPVISLAQGLENPIASKTIPEFITKFLEGALKIGIPVIVLAVIYCGFLFVAARGNPEKVTKAKDALLYTVIGAAVLLGSLAIAKLVAETIKAL